MPCGGIWAPEPGSHWLSTKCWECGQTGCELFCDEWDTPLHIKCLGKFLQSDEGQIVINHKHSIFVPEGHPIKFLIDQMHPNGRCTCAGEGKCQWCCNTERMNS